jgi:hypothetical protein
VLIVPVPSIVLVDVVVEELVVTAGFVVVVVVDEVCAKAVVSAIALTAPAANNVVNLFCFMFVLCFVERMLSVVHLSDCPNLKFIQLHPHSFFVTGRTLGRFS